MHRVRGYVDVWDSHINQYVRKLLTGPSPNVLVTIPANSKCQPCTKPPVQYLMPSTPPGGRCGPIANTPQVCGQLIKCSQDGQGHSTVSYIQLHVNVAGNRQQTCLLSQHGAAMLC